MPPEISVGQYLIFCYVTSTKRNLYLDRWRSMSGGAYNLPCSQVIKNSSGLKGNFFVQSVMLYFTCILDANVKIKDNTARN